MQSIPISSLSSSLPSPTASIAGKSPASGTGEVTSFLTMLGLITGDSAHEGTGGENKGDKTDTSPASSDPSAATLTGLFSDLTTSEVKGLLEAMAGGAAGAIGNTGSLSADGSGAGGSATGSGKTPEQQVEKLLLGLLALFAAKEGGSDSAAGQNGVGGDTTHTQGDGSSAAGQGTGKKGTKPSTSSDSQSTQGSTASDDQATLETIALLVFHGLQAVFQKQDHDASITGVGTNGPFSGDGESVAAGGQGTAPGTQGPANGATSGNGEAIPNGTVGWQKIIGEAVASGNSPSNATMPAAEGEADKSETAPAVDLGSVPNGVQDPLKQIFETVSTREASRREKMEGLLNDVSVTAKAVSGPGTEDKSSFGPSVALTPSTDDGRGAGGITFAIKGSQTETPYGAGAIVTGELSSQNDISGSLQEGDKDDVMATTVVHDLSQLLQNQGENASKGDTGNKGGSSGQENYQLAGWADPGAATGAAQEQGGKVSDRSTAGEAVEKFQQVLDQFATKAGQHDLTVKLDIGSEGSLVLGMKDLGQTVTVEVKASHDSMVDLLQSQRDTIIRHLEGKDVHTNFVIDPNASGTPERRDRRETGQQSTFRSSTPEEDEGFEEFLELLV